MFSEQIVTLVDESIDKLDQYPSRGALAWPGKVSN